MQVEWNSEIAEPAPIPVPATELHKPSAWDVKNRDCGDPHCIDEWKTVTIAIRPLREIRYDCAMPNWLMEGERNDNCDQVNEVEMQDVIEEGHPAKYQQDAA